MILADQAEILRLDRAAVPLHGGEQLADLGTVDAIAVAEEFCGNDRRDAPISSSTSFCLALPERPRNSLMNSRTVRGSRP